MHQQLSRPNSRRGQGREVGPDGWSTAGTQAPPPPRPTKAGDLQGFGTFRASQPGRERILGPSSTFSRKASSSNIEKDAGEAPRSQNAFAALAAAEGESIAEEAQAEPSAEEDAEEAPAEKPVLDQATLDRMIKNLVAEFFQLRKIEEGVDGFRDLPVDSRPKLVEAYVDKAINAKEAEVKLVALLFGAIADAALVTPDDFKAAFRPSITELPDTATGQSRHTRYAAG
jgi:translation initiation factor 4G